MVLLAVRGDVAQHARQPNVGHFQDTVKEIRARVRGRTVWASVGERKQQKSDSCSELCYREAGREERCRPPQCTGSTGRERAPALSPVVDDFPTSLSESVTQQSAARQAFADVSFSQSSAQN